MKNVWKYTRGRHGIAAMAAMACGLVSAIPQAKALEQPPQYPIGVGTIYDSFYPPVPGLFGFLYQLNLYNDSLRDGNGNKAAGIDKFDFKLHALAARVVGVWDATFLGAKPISWVSIPMATFDGEIDFTGGGSAGNKNFRIGDMSIAQGLSWNFNKSWSAEASLEVFLPTGPYSLKKTFNFGANITTFIPNAGVTYWNHDTNDTFSFKAQYLISTENDRTRYKNGDSMDLEGGVGIGLGRFGVGLDKWGLDLIGFALIQVENDSGKGVPPGKKSQLFGIGPQLRYNFDAGAIAFKWEHEFGGENIGQGERLWVQTGFPLSVKEKPLDAPLK